MDGEQTLDWRALDRVWDMLMSKDEEMVKLGLSIAGTIIATDPDIFIYSYEFSTGDVNKTFNDEFRANLNRYIYRKGISDPVEQKNIIRFAKEAKARAVALKLYGKASFWRDVERALFWVKE